MATVADLLHHLVNHAPGLSEENRQEYHDLIDAEVADHGPEAAPETPQAPGQ